MVTVPDVLLDGPHTDLAGPVVEMDDLALRNTHDALRKRDGIWVPGGCEALQLGVLREQAEPILVSVTR